MDAVFGITQERLIGHKPVVVSHSFACCRFMGVHGFLPHNDEEKTKTSAKKDGGYGLSHELVTVKKRLSRMLSPAEKARRPSAQESVFCDPEGSKLIPDSSVR